MIADKRTSKLSILDPRIVFALVCVCATFLFTTQYDIVFGSAKEGGIIIEPKESETIVEPANKTINLHNTAGTSSSPSSSLFGRSHCLDSEEELDALIFQASNHVTFITMPAKAAGSSMKAFVKECTKKSMPENRQKLPDNFLNRQDLLPNIFLNGSVEGLHPTKIVASHLYNGEPLPKLVINSPYENLLIYVHRNERERLVSAIKQVVKQFAKSRPSELCNVSYNETARTCVVSQDELLKHIRRGTYEIGCSQANILTCDLYEAIEMNSPNILFMDYKEADRLHRLLAKHHCPDLDLPIHENVDGSKRIQAQVRIQARPEHVLIDLDDWLDIKADYISLSFELQNQRTCQAHGRTREMEIKLQECPTGVIKI